MVRKASSVIIGSSVKGDSKFAIARDKYDKSQGNLIGVVSDIRNVYNLFAVQKIDVNKIFLDVEDANKAIVLEEIKKLFKNKKYNDFVLYYSGHGKTYSGDWCFSSSLDEKEELQTIACEDILKLWNMCKNEEDRLFIICDSCFSGNWVKYFENYDKVFVQASCLSDQTCCDGKEGGLFTQLWTKYWQTPPSSKSFFKSLNFFSSIPTVWWRMFKYVAYDVWNKKFSPICTKSASDIFLDVGNGLHFSDSWANLMITKGIQ